MEVLILSDVMFVMIIMELPFIDDAYSLLLMLFSMISIDLIKPLNGQLAKYIILMLNCVMLDL
jgi:hypothetical protein